MPLYRLAMILEISGFLFASIFGLIFLSRDVAGDLAIKLDKKINNISLSVSLWLYKWLSQLLKYSAFITENEVTRQMLAGIMVRGFAVIIILLGLKLDVLWLFWIGVALASLYALLTAIVTLGRVVYLSHKHKRWLFLFSYPLWLSWGFLLGFVIAPIIVFIYLIVIYVALAVSLLASALTISDNLKKILIITGSILVATGLILEAVATW